LCTQRLETKRPEFEVQTVQTEEEWRLCKGSAKGTPTRKAGWQLGQIAREAKKNCK
jgi:hypothetical protein